MRQIGTAKKQNLKQEHTITRVLWSHMSTHEMHLDACAYLSKPLIRHSLLQNAFRQCLMQQFSHQRLLSHFQMTCEKFFMILTPKKERVPGDKHVGGLKLLLG